jgi:vacuolar iron transporter family protein
MKLKSGEEHNELIHPAKYIKSIVYGGLDGIITTFAIVAGVAGASLSANIVLILGFANLIADGISMAAGDYLSTKSEIESHKNKQIFKKKLRKLMRINDLEKSPVKSSMITFMAFVIFGLVPLLAYVIQFFSPYEGAFFISIVLTAIALFSLGSLKCKITNKGFVKSGFETLLIGGVAAGAAFYIGYLISKLV